MTQLIELVRILGQFKKNLDLAGVEIDRFIPLVPEVKNSINYREEHINPVYWTHGGTSTRNFVRNSDYNKKLVINKNLIKIIYYNIIYEL